MQYTDVPEDIEPEEIRPMGNYAVSITWPDGFSQVSLLYYYYYYFIFSVSLMQCEVLDSNYVALCFENHACHSKFLLTIICH